ncbi:MAG: hypothetical protein V8R30_04115 [Clostridia bacterium]|jgi:hypothetical protein
MKNKGVTLISLVVTIIVLLILAGITIGTIFNDNGIIKKAQEAANATEEAAKNDQAAINGLLNEMDSIINGTGGGQIPIIGSINGKITWSTGSATLTLTTDVEGVTIQYRKNSESNWTNYTSAVPSLLHGDKVYARGVKGGETVINEKEFKIQDTIAPTVTIANTSSTTNSISATATATDNEAGMGSNPQYTFYIKKTTEADSAYTQIGSSANTSVIKGELEQNTSYTIKVEVADVAGNKGQATKEITTGKIADAGEGLTNGAIIASSPVWSNGTASITLSTSSGLTIQYQKGGISGSWTTGTNVTGLHHRDTVFARLTDGKNYGGEASITILDTVIPQDAGISLSGTSTTTTGSVTATVTLKDNESGVNATASKWTYNTNSGNIGTNESSYNNNFSSNGQTITLKATTAGTYYLHVLTVDNAGNKKETISNAVTVRKLTVGGDYDEEKGINTPQYDEKQMTPIKWNGSSWVETKGSDPDWYDYTAKKWANAKTSDGSMWVWIPRYAYSITSGYHSSIAGNIDVEFMKGTSNETSTGRTTFQNASGQGNWSIHPAFNYGQTVSGIWVAKFEASPEGATTNTSNSEYNGTGKKLQVKPGVSSWRSIAISNIYDVCKNYNSTLNSHMMKNDEWGAVAYLSKSKYGKQNEEVWINNSSSYITGSAGNIASAVSNAGTTNDYTSTQGVKASTTGTVYGVYDMSGGAWEYVAAYVNNGDFNLKNYGSSLVNGDAKTKNVYSKGSTNSYEDNYKQNKGVYGDALYETSINGNSRDGSWYDDYSIFPISPFFIRGGSYNNGTNAGMFAFYADNGNIDSFNSFRPVLVAL